MFKRYLFLFTFLWFASCSLSAQRSAFLEYIEEYSTIAVQEMERAGVPASIKLAQGLLESNAGRSELAQRARNHFGIKCHSTWTGRTYHKEDDDYDEFGNLQKSCFRRYRRAVDSWIAHSEFLRDPKKENRYGFLFRLDATDYKRWARGLKRAGYATAAGYDTKLIRLIEEYELYQYDRMAINNFPENLPTRDRDIIAGLDVRRVNQVRVVFAKNNVTVEQIANLADIPSRRLRRYNDSLPDLMEPLPDDYPVFLQPKRCRHRGQTKWHYVKEGQTMLEISNEYAVKLKRLYKRNRMEMGTQPQAGQRLKLKGFRIPKRKMPRLRSEPRPTTVDVPLVEPDDDFMDDDITPENPGTGSDDDFTPPEIDNSRPDSNPSSPNGEMMYTVVKGDTLYGISRRFGLTVNELMQMNNLTSTTLSIGQVLKVK
jgi:LysM repeat protein